MKGGISIIPKMSNRVKKKKKGWTAGYKSNKRDAPGSHKVKNELTQKKLNA